MEFHKRFFDFCAGDSGPVQLELSALADLVGHALNPPFRYETRLRRQLERIDALLARREKLDAYMAREDLRRAPVRRAYRTRLETVESFNASSSLLPAAARSWVDKREAEFR